MVDQSSPKALVGVRFPPSLQREKLRLRRSADSVREGSRRVFERARGKRPRAADLSKRSSSNLRRPMIKIIKRIIENIKKNPQVGSLVLLATGVLLFSVVALSQNHESKSEEILVDTDFDINNSKANSKDVESTNPPTPAIPDNYADMSSPVEETYNLSSFGIFSSYFENKKIEKIESKYKGALITSRYITMDDIKLSTWTIDKQTGVEKIDLPALPKRFLPDDNTLQKYYDFPILDAYEWWFVVVDEKFVSSRIPENAPQDKYYTSKRGITMYKELMSCPKSFCGAILKFHTLIENGERQLFVIMYKTVDYFEVDEAALTKRHDEAFRELEQLADTLSFESY